MRGLLEQHAPQSLVCFGAPGPRTLGQLAAFVERIRSALPEPSRDAVVLTCRDRYFFIAGLLAALSRGFQVWLPPNGRPEAVAALLAGRRVAAVLSDEGGVGIALPALEQPEREIERLAWDAHDPDAAWLVLFTSGSTGTPEGHVRSLGQLLREAKTHVRDFGLGGRRLVAGVPAQHIYGLLFSVLVPLSGGGSALRKTPLFPQELAAELSQHGADVLVSVPPQLNALADDASVQLKAMHRVFCSAGPLPRETHLALGARGLTVTEILGSTETGGIAFREHPDALYQPLSGVRIGLDADAVLHVDAPWLSHDAPRPFRTADRAEITDAGFRHLGRADAVAKIAGRRVDLGDVEACLRSVPQVRDARVLAVDAGGVRGLTLWAVVESDEVSVERLREALKHRFDPVTLPKRFRVVAKLPRSEQGKVRRDDLLALFDAPQLRFESRPDGSVEIVVPPGHAWSRGLAHGEVSLPPAAQLQEIVLACVHAQHPELGAPTRASEVVFSTSPTAQGALVVRLSALGTDSSLRFALEAGEQRIGSGVFHFSEVAR